MKLEIVVPKVNDFVEQFKDFDFIHEYEIKRDNFIGYVDLILQHKETKECIVMDFKYSNHIKNYLDSGQLHIYKYYLEQDGFNVKRLGYLFVPKVNRRQDHDNNEDLHTYRQRVLNELDDHEIRFVPIEYDEMEMVYFVNSIKKIRKAIRENNFPKNVTGNCFSCNPRFAPIYLDAIQNDKGDVEMVLPKNVRREKKIDERPDFWIYGDSYVGKSTFVDHVDNVLFLNTDGNTDNTTAPVIAIKDEVKKEGRRTVRTLAWETFLDVIEALETDENDYEAVAIDLMEDLYEHCRYFVFEENGWEHETDGGFGKGWSKVATEWQSAIKRLKMLGYQIIYISKELREEITLKGGATRTTFKPNINDKVANFLTGTVDLTVRAFADSDDNRHLQLAKKHNVFGGGRFAFKVDTCPLDYDEFLAELVEAQDGKKTKRKKAVGPSGPSEPKDESESKPRKRRSRKRDESEEVDDTVEEQDEEHEEQLLDDEDEELADDVLEEDEDIEVPEDLSSLKIKELRELAEDLGIDVDGLRRKADIIETIENYTNDEVDEVEDDELPPGEEVDEQDDNKQEEERPRRRRRKRR